MEKLLGALKSKTMWASLATLILANVPAITAWVSEHVGASGAALGVVFAILRALTTQSLETKGTGEPSPPASP